MLISGYHSAQGPGGEAPPYSNSNCGRRGRPLIREGTEAATALVRLHTHTSSPHTHMQSNYRARTRPGPGAPADLVLGQIDEALYHPSGSNNSFLALIRGTKGDLQVLRSASAARWHTALVPEWLFLFLFFMKNRGY